jgi:hypothetical protein
MRPSLGAGDAPKSCGDQHQGGSSVREVADDAGPTADLPHESIDGVVGPKASPVLARDGVVAQRCDGSRADNLRRAAQLHLLELASNAVRLEPSLGGVLLGVDGHEHRRDHFHLPAGDYGENIAVEIDDVPLPRRLRVSFAHGFDKSQTLVRDDQVDALQSALLQMAQEVQSAGIVFLGAFHDAQHNPVPFDVDLYVTHRSPHLVKWNSFQVHSSIRTRTFLF